MIRAARALAIALALFAGSGCARDQKAAAAPPRPAAPSTEKAPAKAAPAVVLEPPGEEPVRVNVELARTYEEQQRGLMYRDKLELGRGMLFLFTESRHLEFWMRNTYIPLDMIFITTDRKVLGSVENATPLTENPRGVPGDSQFVLEVPAGFVARYRIKPGTPVRFVDVDRKEIAR